MLTRRAAIARLAVRGLAIPLLAASSAGKAGAIAPPRATPSAPTGLVHRGMTYDTGWGAASGELSREVWRTNASRASESTRA